MFNAIKHSIYDLLQFNFDCIPILGTGSVRLVVFYTNTRLHTFVKKIFLNLTCIHFQLHWLMPNAQRDELLLS